MKSGVSQTQNALKNEISDCNRNSRKAFFYSCIIICDIGLSKSMVKWKGKLLVAEIKQKFRAKYVRSSSLITGSQTQGPER